MAEPQPSDYSSFQSMFTDDKYVYFYRQSQLVSRCQMVEPRSEPCLKPVALLAPPRYGLFRNELSLDSPGLLAGQKMQLPAVARKQWSASSP